jgi:hypothetical protein
MADPNTQVTAGQTLGPSDAYTQYQSPDWQVDTSAAVAGGLQGMLGDTGYINQTMQNWYSAPLTAGYDANSTAAFNQAAQPNQWLGQVQQGTNQGGTYAASLPTSQQYINSNAQGLGTASGIVGQGVGALNQASNQTLNSAAWNPNTQQQFVNPYLTNVLDANARAANQNLTENVLPQVNSTFTGAGQFGSTRNADFTNRALRDNQQALANVNATTLMNAQNQAAQQYSDWANKGMNAGSQLTTNALGLGTLGTQTGNLANSMGNLAAANNTLNKGYLDYGNFLTNQATTGNTLTQQQLQNLMTTGQSYMANQQNALTNSYNDWLKQKDYPLGALGQVGAANAQNAGTIKADVLQSGNQMDSISKLLAASGALTGGADDLSGLWDTVSGWFGNGTTGGTTA